MKKAILLFMSFLYFAAIVGNAQSAIQTTFFGMKMGGRIDATSITKNIGNRGEFNAMKEYGSYTVYFVRNIDFGGSYWSRARFFADSSDRLYRVCLECSFGSESSCQKFYERIKQTLMEKYPLQVEKKGSEGLARYSDGRCTVELAIDHQSVELTYFNQDLAEGVIKAQKDQF